MLGFAAMARQILDLRARNVVATAAVAAALAACGVKGPLRPPPASTSAAPPPPVENPATPPATTSPALSPPSTSGAR